MSGGSDYVRDPFDDLLPAELMLHIFTSLDSNTLFSVSTVCRSWNDISIDSELWEIHFREHFPYISSAILPLYPHDFKQLFTQEQAFLKRAKIKTTMRETRSKFMQPDVHSGRISSWVNIKMTLLGDAGTGKTSFLLRYVNQMFNALHKWLASVGGRRVDLLLCDVPGDKEASSNDPTIRFPVSWDGVDAFILFFSLTDKASLNNIVNYWAPLARRIHGLDVPLVLCGTMCDARDLRVMVSDVCEAIDQLNQVHARHVPYVEVSCRTGENVEQLISIALETISPSFFSHLNLEGPPPEMFRSARQPGYDYDDDGSDDEYLMNS